MGKPLEMYVASRMQNMVQIRARNVGFTTKLLFRLFCILSLGALVVESPQEGAMLSPGTCDADRSSKFQEGHVQDPIAHKNLRYLVDLKNISDDDRTDDGRRRR